MSGPATSRRPSFHSRSMQPSGSTRFSPPPDGLLVHTTAPVSRDARSLYTSPGYAARFRHSCGLTPYVRLKAVDRANALP